MTRQPFLARGRTLVAIALVVGATLAASPWASAAWTAGGSGFAKGAAATMPTGATPTVSVTSTNVLVSWTAVTTSSSGAVGGYVIHRYSSSTGTPATVGSACSGTITATSCTESSVAAGSWVYTVTPVLANWTGGESADSSVAVVP